MNALMRGKAVSKSRAWISAESFSNSQEEASCSSKEVRGQRESAQSGQGLAKCVCKERNSRSGRVNTSSDECAEHSYAHLDAAGGHVAGAVRESPDALNQVDDVIACVG